MRPTIDRPLTDPTPRRGFLARLLGGAAALAGGALIAPATAAARPLDDERAPRTHAAPASEWDMSWTERITGKYRQVFDAPEIAEGTILNQAYLFYSGYAEVYKASDADLNAVLVFRHLAVPMAVGDAIWSKYTFADQKKLKDPATGKAPRRNPFLAANVSADAEDGLIFSHAALDTLIARGAIALACSLALGGFARRLAKATHQDGGTVLDEVKAALVPGVILMPSGVFGVTRAEAAGCSYIRST